MRILIESAWNTAYDYKDLLKDYNYEHILINDYSNDISNLSKDDYEDYITIDSLEDILTISNKIGHKIMIDNRKNNIYDGIPYLLIYDDYIE